MAYLRKRLEDLEAALAPRGKPIVIWAMVGDRAMTEAEINAEIAAFSAIDPVVQCIPVRWLTTSEAA